MWYSFLHINSVLFSDTPAFSCLLEMGLFWIQVSHLPFCTWITFMVYNYVVINSNSLAVLLCSFHQEVHNVPGNFLYSLSTWSWVMPYWIFVLFLLLQFFRASSYSCVIIYVLSSDICIPAAWCVISLFLILVTELLVELLNKISSKTDF